MTNCLSSCELSGPAEVVDDRDPVQTGVEHADNRQHHDEARDHVGHAQHFLVVDDEKTEPLRGAQVLADDGGGKGVADRMGDAGNDPAPRRGKIDGPPKHSASSAQDTGVANKHSVAGLDT